MAKVGEGLCLIEVEEDVAEEASSAAPHTQRPTSEAPSQPLEPAAIRLETPPTHRNLHPLDPTRKFNPCRLQPGHSDVSATPSVRHFARQNGVDLSAVGAGSGKGGRIEKKDIETFLSLSTAPSQSPEDLRKEIQVELGRTRFAMWKAMTKVLDCIDLLQSCSHHISEFGNSAFWVFYHPRPDAIIRDIAHVECLYPSHLYASVTQFILIHFPSHILPFHHPSVSHTPSIRSQHTLHPPHLSPSVTQIPFPRYV